jgi:CubicO group peptidase (beta-lactamase class C family)
MSILDQLFIRFKNKFPKTTKLLDEAINVVFPSYAVGVSIPQKSENKKDQFLTLFHTNNANEDTLFDLASLTKIICTTTLFAIFEEKALISIEESVQSYFPSFPRSDVKIKHLLDHTSGLKPWLDLHSLFHEKESLKGFDPRTTPKIARLRYETEIIKSYEPDAFLKDVVYSDLGFMLLGWILEKKMNAPLDSLFQEYVIHPYRLDSIQFLPTSFNIAPTEFCPWRKRLLCGEVHDDNCYVLGGVAGHAGLFGNVMDVQKFGLHWLKALIQMDDSFLTPYMAKKYFTEKNLEASCRSLGFDGISPNNSSAGTKFSKSTRGHLGFTGTSIWIDPEQKIVVTLLTNRVCPTRTNEKIKEFRPIFHDTLLNEIHSQFTLN